MDKQIISDARRELRTYRQYKKMTANLSTKKRSWDKSLLRAVIMIACMDSALSMVSEDVREYARLRYFSDKDSKLDIIGGHLDVSARTINRWNEQLVMAVAIQIVSFRNVAKQMLNRAAGDNVQ